MTNETTVATCTVCGAKYRPAGGACIHEQRSEMWLAAAGPASTRFATGSVEAARREVTGYDCHCGQCGVLWQPGHTCIPQPTMAQVQELAAMGSVLRLMDEIMERLAEELGVAAPTSWEAM